jgi:hypothetical protein
VDQHVPDHVLRDVSVGHQTLPEDTAGHLPNSPEKYFDPNRFLWFYT